MAHLHASKDNDDILTRCIDQSAEDLVHLNTFSAESRSKINAIEEWLRLTEFTSLMDAVRASSDAAPPASATSVLAVATSVPSFFCHLLI